MIAVVFTSHVEGFVPLSSARKYEGKEIFFKGECLKVLYEFMLFGLMGIFAAVLCKMRDYSSTSARINDVYAVVTVNAQGKSC